MTREKNRVCILQFTVYGVYIYHEHVKAVVTLLVGDNGVEIPVHFRNSAIITGLHLPLGQTLLSEGLAYTLGINICGTDEGKNENISEKMS
jgi:hypothetical protein